MPAARKRTTTSGTRASSASKSRRTTTVRPLFKEPAALKRLGRSLETADAALMDLRKSAGRDVGQAAGAVYKDLQKFLTSARRDSRKLSAALRRDFEQASKELDRSQRQLKGRPAAKRSAPARRKATK